jgi:transcriptional regulator of acetoin/glycerol metabolism
MNEPAVCEQVISLREARQNAIDAFEKSYLKFVLQKAQGNITRAAASVEISRQMFHKLLRKHAIE